MCMACGTINTFDSARSELFGEQLVDMMNKGALSLMISIGHRTGLFDTMSKLPFARSEEIATKAELNERYVREWLGAMVAGRIVDYDQESRSYHLPSEHAALLTRESASDNIATLTQYIAELGSVESKIVDCFREGGGVPYEEFPRFHEVMAEDSGQSVIPALETHIIPLVPGLEKKLQSGIKVLDVGCGRGKALMQLAERYPQSSFYGYDISAAPIEWARAETQRRRLLSLNFAIKDAASIQAEEEFDVVFTFDSIHDQKEPKTVLRNIQRALRSDGVYLMQDIDMNSEVGENLDHPIGPLLYTISCMHCMSVSLSQDGAGLGAAWGVQLAQEMLAEAGFVSTEIHRLAHDIQNAYFVNRKN